MSRNNEPAASTTTEEERSVAAYSASRRWASAHGLKDLWVETDRLIRLHVKARGWQELQQETTARQLVPLLIPVGARVANGPTLRARINRAVTRLSRELDDQLNAIAQLTWACYDSAPRFRTDGRTRQRNPGLNVEAVRLGLETTWAKGARGPSAKKRLSIRAANAESAVGIVKSVAGSLTLTERCVVDGLHQRGWRLVPPCHVMESLLDWSDEITVDAEVNDGPQDEQNSQNSQSSQKDIVTTTSKTGSESGDSEG